MQLNVTTDYAVRIVLYLASKKDVANSGEIAREMGIPPNYILKLMKTLKEGGVLSEKRGVDGGFMLKAAPEELTLWTILNLFEKTMVINKCLEGDPYCSRNAVAYCKVRDLLGEVQNELYGKLNVKISELL